MESIREARAKFQSLSEPWADTTTHAGKMIMTIFAGIAEFERDLIRERTSAGGEAAQKRGVRFGRPRKLSIDQEQLARRLVWKAKQFPTSPEPLTFTLQRSTDSLTPIPQTFKSPFIHEHAICRITVVVWN
jgi:hypothetical protein